MLVNKRDAIDASIMLFGSSDPPIVDLDDQQYQFFQTYLAPLLDRNDPVDPEAIADLLTEIDVLDEIVDPDWLDTDEIFHRLFKIVRDSGLAQNGIAEDPDPLDKLFGAHYIPDGVSVVEDEESQNGVFVLVTSWKDIGYLQREYNRRYNPLFYRLWQDRMDDDPKQWQNVRIKSGDRSYRPEGLVDLWRICDIGFNDEYDLCSECGGLIRTYPDCHSWLPDFWDQEGWGRVCGECVRNDEDLAASYIESHVRQNAKGITVSLTTIVDPMDHGFVQLETRYENGFHYGQNDDPSAIAELLTEGEIPVLFTGYTGQFDVTFYAWVPTEHVERAQRILETGKVTLPYDQATEYSKALKGEHSDYVSVRKITVSRDGEISEEQC